jgi:hypothetical protein
MDFQESGHLNIFRKSVERFQVLFHSDKNSGYFTCKHMYIYDNISLNSSHNEKRFKCSRENQNTHFILSKSVPKYGKKDGRAE